MPLETDIQALTVAVSALTIAIQSMGGAALVGTPGTAADDTRLAKAAHFNLPGEKRVVKVEAGGERPLGGVEVSAKEAKTLEAKYAEGNGGQSSQTGAGAAQSQASTTASSGAGATSPTPDEGPTWKEVQDAITALSKQEGKGRDSVVKLFKLWGVETFPKAQGVKPNADLLKDIAAEAAPPADGTADLGI